MLSASSFGRDHIGQWLVGRSTHAADRFEKADVFL
jgi:hypothetical protein